MLSRCCCGMRNICGMYCVTICEIQSGLPWGDPPNFELKSHCCCWKTNCNWNKTCLSWLWCGSLWCIPVAIISPENTNNEFHTRTWTWLESRRAAVESRKFSFVFWWLLRSRAATSGWKRLGRATLLCSALLSWLETDAESPQGLTSPPLPPPRRPDAEEPAAGTTSSGFRLHAERLAGPCVRATLPLPPPLSSSVLRIHSLSIRPRRDADCVHCRPDFLDCSVMFFSLLFWSSTHREADLESSPLTIGMLMQLQDVGQAALSDGHWNCFCCCCIGLLSTSKNKIYSQLN
jgi:hypothetical protein